MPGILPDLGSGGVVVRDGAGAPTSPPGVYNAYIPDPAFTSTQPLTALPENCLAHLAPAQVNAVVSEMLCLAETLDPTGNWDGGALCNLSVAFNNWFAGWVSTVPVATDTIQGRVALAVAANYPAQIANNTDAATPAYVNAAIDDAFPAGAWATV